MSQNFASYSLKIKYVEFKDKPNNFYLKNWECEGFSARILIKELPTRKK